MRLLFATFATAFTASVLLTPLVRYVARQLGIVDHPDRHRKLHSQATPLGGGVAVLAAFLFAIGVVLTYSDSQRSVVHENFRFLGGLIASAVIVCAVGLVDDRFNLRGRQKLFGQVLAASALLASGLVIERVQIFGLAIDLGLLAVPFTMFWLLGAINALNLLDGMDGLATSIGLVVSLAISTLAMLTGHPTEAFLALAIAGGLAGFLVYNSPPASIFLGDGGSMLVGLVLGALAVRGSLKGPTTILLAAPTAVFAIPIFDVAMAMLRRRLTGRSIYTTDRGHLHHTLLNRGFSSRKTVAVIGLLCCVTSVGATLSVFTQQEWMSYVAVLAVCSVLVVTRLFGHHECHLVVQRAKGLFTSLVPSLRRDVSPPLQVRTRFCGDRDWEELWKTLIGFAERFDLSAVQLNVNLPAIGEEYHASWHRKQRPAEAEFWHSDIPLVVHGQAVGRLRITGASTDGSVCTWMGDLIAGLQPFETQMLDLLEDSLFNPGEREPVASTSDVGLQASSATARGESGSAGFDDIV